MTQQTNHTPGPWSAEWTTHRAGSRKEGWHIYVKGPGGEAEPLICKVPDGRLDEAEEANARLIAAAPDLLAALVALVEEAKAKGAVFTLGLIRAHTALSKACPEFSPLKTIL